MSSWRNTTVSDLGEIITGYTPPIKKAEYFGDEYPFITPTDIMIDSRIVQTERFLSQKGYEYRKNRLLPRDAVCVTCIGATIGKTCMTTVPSTTNQQINSVVVNQDKYDPYFVYYLLRTKTDVLQSIASGAVTPIVKKSTFASINVCVPLLSTQRKIANFLDGKTGQIDELIRSKERQVELLQEQRAALINQVVTKGLDPKVEMKPSGVEWIGEIPAHWEIKRLKHMAQGGLTNGLFKKKDQFGSGVKLINVIDMYQDDFLVRFKELDRVEAEPHEVERYAVEPGDIFFVRSSLKLEGVAASACITDVPESTVFECHLVRLQPCPRQVLSKYLINYLNSTETRQRLITLANTVTMTTISQPKLASLEIILPPLSEQQTIADYLDQRTRETNELISTEQRKIELLKEYRQSLISEAVTGKIDVRNEV